VSKTLAGGGGTVRLADLCLYVEPLPFRLEEALLLDLRRLAKSLDGDYYAACLPVLDRLAKESKDNPQRAADRAAMVDAVTRMEALRVLPSGDAAEAARRTPKGVALELWYRARRSTPSLQLRELESVVTAANADDLFWQLLDALAGGGDDPKAIPSP
jgi:hypothetical protein